MICGPGFLTLSRMRRSRQLASDFPRPGFLLFPLLLSLTFCGAGRAQTPIVPPASERPPPEQPTALPDKIYAQVWIDFSPEYRALCLQTFNTALRAVREQVARAPRVSGKPVDATGKPLAVIADLDETILDNSGYQAELILRGADYSPESWQAWVERVQGVADPGSGSARWIRKVNCGGLAGSCFPTPHMVRGPMSFAAGTHSNFFAG